VLCVMGEEKVQWVSPSCPSAIRGSEPVCAVRLRVFCVNVWLLETVSPKADCAIASQTRRALPTPPTPPHSPLTLL
jgi:hypothetical protein